MALWGHNSERAGPRRSCAVWCILFVVFPHVDLYVISEFSLIILFHNYINIPLKVGINSPRILQLNTHTHCCTVISCVCGFICWQRVHWVWLFSVKFFLFGGGAVAMLLLYYVSVFYLKKVPSCRKICVKDIVQNTFVLSVTPKELTWKAKHTVLSINISNCG